MRALFLLCITTACMAAVVIGSTCPTCDQDKVTPEMKARMQANDQKLNKLIARTVDVSETISRRNKERHDADLQAINMLQKLEGKNGSECKGQFVCGGAPHKCVPNLLVCDGTNDCDNAADESDNICNPPVKSGDEWVGRFVYHNCSTHNFGKLRLVVHSFIKKTTMKSLADVSATLFWNDNSKSHVDYTDSLPYTGIYMYSTRTGRFEINYQGNVYYELFYFSPGEGDVLHYDVHFANSQMICARAYLHKH